MCWVVLNHVPPSEQVNVALVGAGGRGLQNARELMKLDDVRITAVADPAAHWDLSNFYYRGVAGREPAIAEINKRYRQNKAEFQCAAYEDYRDLLEQQKDLDAILCATPDHQHATISVRAMREKKHVYCEKPLTHNVREARLVAQVAKETGVATQLGNQGHSTETIRETVEWIKSWSRRNSSRSACLGGRDPLEPQHYRSTRERTADSQRTQLGSLVRTSRADTLSLRLRSGELSCDFWDSMGLVPWATLVVTT